MKLLILSDLFSLDSWLIHDQEPEIMPAVYEFFQQLGISAEHSFDCIIFHKSVRKKISFSNGSTIEIHPLGIPLHYPRKFVSLFAMSGIAKRKLVDRSYDVIYGMSIYSIVAARLGKRSDIPSVGRIFGSLLYDVLQHQLYAKLYTRHILQLAEAKYPCDLTICTEDGTEFDRALEVINPKHRIHMLYNGMSDMLRRTLKSYDHVKRLDSLKKIRMLSIGRLTHWKRHDLSIRVLHALRNHHQVDAELTVIGRGKLKRKLQNLAKSLHLEEVVIFKEGIAHATMPQEIAAHDIGLFLYDASNLGNALWETALSGRLLVVRDTGKTSTIFRDDVEAIIVQNDPDAIASSIAAKLNKDISNICRSGRWKVDALLPSWQNRIAEEMQLISELVQSKGLS